VSASLDRLRTNKKLMAYAAGAMYGGAALDGAIAASIPGDPGIAVAPVVVAGVIVALLLAVGPRLPRWALAPLGPIGVLVIAYAMSGVHGAGDGAVLYMWPVLWSTFFFGRRGAVSIVACIGVAHAVTLLSLPAASSFPGRWIDVMVSASLVAGVVLTLVGRNDRLLAQLSQEARTDSLTGLLNRRGFDERASLELAHARRDGSSLAMATFDLDYFKRINDEWGHETGDGVLTRMGRLLREETRDIDLAARFGGEEFVVMLPGSTSADAQAFAERVRRKLAAADRLGLPTVRVSVGILAARAPESVEAMLRGADSALYAAKHGGRNRTNVFERRDHAIADAFS
jgi:diguanylate cyclase (GGDEF)-like protein